MLDFNEISGWLFRQGRQSKFWEFVLNIILLMDSFRHRSLLSDGGNMDRIPDPNYDLVLKIINLLFVMYFKNKVCNYLDSYSNIAKKVKSFEME